MLTLHEARKRIISKRNGRPISYSYIVLLVKTGKIKTTKKGRMYFIDEKELEKFLKENGYER